MRVFIRFYRLETTVSANSYHIDQRDTRVPVHRCTPTEISVWTVGHCGHCVPSVKSLIWKGRDWSVVSTFVVFGKYLSWGKSCLRWLSNRVNPSFSLTTNFKLYRVLRVTKIWSMTCTGLLVWGSPSLVPSYEGEPMFSWDFPYFVLLSSGSRPKVKSLGVVSNRIYLRPDYSWYFEWSDTSSRVCYPNIPKIRIQDRMKMGHYGNKYCFVLSFCFCFLFCFW